MSRRKAFSIGDGAFLIEDEYAQEVYVGVAKIDLDSTSVQKATEELRKPRPRYHNRVSVWVTVCFSIGCVVLGLVLAQVMR